MAAALKKIKLFAKISECRIFSPQAPLNSLIGSIKVYNYELFNIIHICRGGWDADHVVQHGEAAEGGRGHGGGGRGEGDEGADQDQGQGGEQHQQQHGQLQEVEVRKPSFLLEVK